MSESFGAPGRLEGEELVKFGSDYRLARAFWIASMTLILYEICLTSSDELQHMWQGKFMRTRPLYWATRYWPTVNLVFDNFVLASVDSSDTKVVPTQDVTYQCESGVINSRCNFWIKWLVYTNVLNRTFTVVILVLRLNVMYGCNRKLLLVLCACIVVELVSETTILIISFSDVQVLVLPRQFTGCIPTNVKPYAWTYWIPVLVFESILFLLALVKSIRRGRENAETPYLLIVLLRDSIIYYGGTLGIILTNFLVWKLKQQTLFMALIPVNFAINSILGCRMLLNIQTAGKRYRYLGHRTNQNATSIYTTVTPTTYPSQTMEFRRSSTGLECRGRDLELDNI